MLTDETWLTPAQAADLLRVSYQTIIRHCQRKIFRSFRIGAQWRVSQQSIERFIEAQNPTRFQKQCEQ